MKRLIGIIAVLTLILTLIPITANAANGTYGALRWTISGDTLTITGSGEMPEYTYPSSSDYPWNSYASQVKNIKIEYGVTSVAAYAFQNFTSVETVSLPYDLTSIGDNAFQDCKKLTDIEIPEDVTTVGNYAFNRCDALTSVTGCEKVAYIGKDAFSYCYKLASVELGSNLTEIDNYAFYYCYALRYVNIPKGVTKIGQSAFHTCKELTSVTIPESVLSIDNYAFSNCNKLTDVYYSGRRPDWKQINIGEYNDCLTGATLNCSDVSLNVTKTNNIYTVTPTNVYNGEYIIFACYNGNELVSVTPYKYSGEPSVPFTSDKGYDKVKISVWESLFKCNPLCDVNISYK